MMRKIAGPLILFAVIILAFQWPKIKEMIQGTSDLPTSAFHWEHDFAAAKKLSQEQGKPMMVVFSASWCPPCKQMKREVWPDAEVGKLVNDHYVPIYLDVDESQNKELTEKYGVDAIPFIIIINPQGSVIHRNHTMSRDEALVFLTQSLQS